MRSRILPIKVVHAILLTCAIFAVILLYNFNDSYDFNNYKNWFETVNSYYSPHFILKDPIYYLLSVFYGSLGLTVFFPIATLIVISLFSKLLFIYRFSYPVFFIFIWLYFCRVFFIHDLIQFRIAAASGFGALFISSLVRDNKKRSFFWLCLAIATHMSTALYLFTFSFLKLSKKSCSTNRYFYLFLLFIPICLILGASDITLINSIGSIPIIGSRVIPYLNGTYAYEGLSLINTYLIAKTSFYIIFIAINSSINKERQNQEGLIFHYISFFCSVFGTCLFLLFRWNDALALRFSDIFLIFDILFFSMFINYFSPRQRISVFLTLIIMGLFFLHSSLKV